MNGRFAFRTDLPFNPANPVDVSGAAVHPRAVAQRHPDADERLRGFAQNKWTAGDLTLNAGRSLRPGEHAYQADARLSIRSSRTRASYAVDKNNIAPRLGFTWKPGGSATSVIRGGYGRFYDKVVLITTAPFLYQSIYSSSFTAAFPTTTADPGPSPGQLPTDPFSELVPTARSSTGR